MSKLVFSSTSSAALPQSPSEPRSIKSENQEQQLQAMQFTARWGFLSRDIYFKYFCYRDRSKQYLHWQKLTHSGFFVRSKVNKNICYLTNKGRKTLATESQPARFHLYVEHDTIVADLILSLQYKKKIMSYWIESELKSDLMTAYSVLGGERIDRFPDAVIDVNVNGKVERFAVEIERKVKSRFRYNKMVMNYSYYKKLKGVLFGCSSSSTAQAIQKSFFESHLATTDFKIGTYLYDEFEACKFASRVQTQAKAVTLSQFLFQNSDLDQVQNSNSKVGLASHLESELKNEDIF